MDIIMSMSIGQKVSMQERFVNVRIGIQKGNML